MSLRLMLMILMRPDDNLITPSKSNLFSLTFYPPSSIKYNTMELS
jgi:hypothetical protein